MMFFSSVLVYIDNSEMGLYVVPKLLLLFGFGMSILLLGIHMCSIMLVLRTSVFTCVKSTLQGLVTL